MDYKEIRSRYDKANLRSIVNIDSVIFASLQDILVLLKRVEELEKQVENKCEHEVICHECNEEVFLEASKKLGR